MEQRTGACVGMCHCCTHLVHIGWAGLVIGEDGGAPEAILWRRSMQGKGSVTVVPSLLKRLGISGPGQRPAACLRSGPA